MGCLLDSNIVIDYLAERFKGQLIKLDAIIDAALDISIITKIETLGFNRDAEEEMKMLRFINAANVYYLSDDIVSKTIWLRKSKKIKTPDAIIATTALVYNLDLLSRNLSDFNNIAGLKVVDPHSF